MLSNIKQFRVHSTVEHNFSGSLD